ncbi:GNAT family N-acetyltransferase [Clostridium sp. HBUAS56010]|uniref:GNAT family N-acetyltransferase n=1 Tax=Clostridium sp. HBUAS56010 TaxID=2571127 RepID=UPI00117802DB|nr:GNAT family N-acetyltransferase [Clostridium sp. HBUAS56010]
MEKNYKFLKAYQDNDTIRKSFNGLAQTTFGIDFEDWYQNGYWKNKYIPYSFVDGDQVIANVSVSPMRFLHNGAVRNYIQLGTVMTSKPYRNQGLIRKLIHEVESDYLGKADGYFLFANDRVLDFYTKFGYQSEKEYSWSKEMNIDTGMTAKKVSMKGMDDWKRFEKFMESSNVQSSLWMQENMELIMFYTTGFLSENVYMVESQKAYVIAEFQKGTLFLHQIFSPQKININEIASAFGKDVKKVILGFSPLETEDFKLEEITEQDTTLFVKGILTGTIEKFHQRIPTLSHT